MPVRFLLRYHRRTGDARRAADGRRVTLERMAAGGIHDQVGGGFHRYATDARWLVPHFEKMLYDNALLALAYLEAYQVTGRADFADVAREILDYVAREMTSPEGGFYSATDADSPARTATARRAASSPGRRPRSTRSLGPDEARLVRACYGVTPAGNFDGRSILHTPRPLDAVADELAIPQPTRRGDRRARARQRLYAARARASAAAPRRQDPRRLERAHDLRVRARGLVARRPGLRGAAAARRRLRARPHAAATDACVRSVTDGRAGHGRLPRRLRVPRRRSARSLRGDRRCALARRGDRARPGARRRTSRTRPAAASSRPATTAETLLAREKPLYDGAEPSGNSVHALNLLRLAELTTDDAYRRRAERVLSAAAPGLATAPGSLGEMLLALDFQLDAPKEIVLVDGAGGLDPFFAALRAQFVPNRVLVVVRGNAPPPAAVAAGGGQGGARRPRHGVRVRASGCATCRRRTPRCSRASSNASGSPAVRAHP